MKTQITKELKKNQTLLTLMPSTDYNEDIIQIAKKLSKKSVCYVTLNKTYSSVQEIFKKNKVNLKNIIFIDGISKSMKMAPDQTDSAYFVSSPGALTELSIVISKFLKHEFEYLVFDSISTLSVYEDMGPIAKFISSLVNKIKEGKTKAIFYAIKSGEQEGLIKQVSTFVDGVVEI